MKFLLILTAAMFLMFSCAGTSKAEKDDHLIEEYAEDHTTEPEELIAEDQPSVSEQEEELIDKISEVEPQPDEDSAVEERLASIEDSLSVIEERLAAIAEALLNQRAVSEPEETVPPSQTQPPVLPPTPVTPPVTLTPVVPPAVPEEPDMEELVEESIEEEPPSRYQPDFPSGPATRLESLTQMGMTPLDSEIIYSRVVRATVGQILEIPFRGSGWVYLGELASRRGIVYNSRRNDPEGQSFVFALEEAGTYALKFYRQDFIRDYILNDHVQVIVGEAPAAGAGWFNPPVDRGRVVAQPRWPSALEEAQIRSGSRLGEPVVTWGAAPEQQAASGRETSPTPAPVPAPASPSAPASVPVPAPGQTPVTTTPSQTVAMTAPAEIQETTVSGRAVPIPETPSANQEILAPDIMLQRAKEIFEGGNPAAAIALLNQFMENYPGGSDEAYWLLGQFYEANSPDRNILLSLDYYRRLINEYPQSGRFNDARRRIAYLERFYINIQ